MAPHKAKLLALRGPKYQEQGQSGSVGTFQVTLPCREEPMWTKTSRNLPKPRLPSVPRAPDGFEICGIVKWGL